MLDRFLILYFVKVYAVSDGIQTSPKRFLKVEREGVIWEELKSL